MTEFKFRRSQFLCLDVICNSPEAGTVFMHGWDIQSHWGLVTFWKVCIQTYFLHLYEIEIALRCVTGVHIGDKSTLDQVMAWCRQATSHYLSQCCQSSWRHMASLGLNELTIYVLNWFVETQKNCIIFKLEQCHPWLPDGWPDSMYWIGQLFLL